ncbi:MAG: hypothetical protein PVG30_08455 [Gammaproteobacteria bacterium]|jgi:hypothetical protein
MSLDLDTAIARGKHRREHFAKKQQSKLLPTTNLKLNAQTSTLINNCCTFFLPAKNDHTPNFVYNRNNTTLPPTP